ncbi:TRAFs-binding domain-containing protein [Roseibium alexandrii]
MPFQKKQDPQTQQVIDFDVVYEQVIHPAIEDAGMAPLRGDEEMAAGIIHKPMFERLMLCDFAVADLTTANANVFYELGIRHAGRPHSTVLMFRKGMQLPFDVALLRGLEYEIGADGLPSDPEAARVALTTKLEACRAPAEDSPLFQLIEKWPRPEVAHLKTDLFRELATYSASYKKKLLEARKAGRAAVHAVSGEIDPVSADPGVVVDLMLSLRAIKDWEGVISLVEQMPSLIADTVMVREQYGMALNRAGRRAAAIDVLEGVIQQIGPNSETNGLLGRVYKDQWSDAREAGEPSRGFLRKAVRTYLEGFEADIRDPYPGINAVTLMEMMDPVDGRQEEILPVVWFSAKRRADRKSADYWDLATMLELAVLRGDEHAAGDHLDDALIAVREIWEPETTANNLQMIADRRRERGDNVGWIDAIVRDLENATVKFQIR